MTDDQLLRYSRHILLDEIGITGQARLLASHALIIGAGGLGSPVALYLASAGVGQLSIVDHDTVDLTNLQRQIVHRQGSIGTNKAASAAQTLAQLNPHTRVQAIAQCADATLLHTLLPQVDVVLDCTDNFSTRHAINQACVAHAKPLVSGAAIGMNGQLSVFDTRHANSPCYACVFPAGSTVQEQACASMGVLAPLVGMVGSMQTVQAVQLLVSDHSAMTGQMALIHAWDMHWDTIRLPRNPDCPICSQRRMA